MIPTTLGESDVTKVLPLAVKETIHQLDEFIVENSKVARGFLKLMKIPTPQSELKLHELNKHTDIQELHSFLKSCRNGKNIGLISDAGCPGIADPGAEIANLAHKEDIKIIPLVGPSSILLSLMASGMNGQSFAFTGYLPIDKSDVKKKLKEFRVKNTENFKPGNELGLEIFKDVKFVDIKSKTIGKGFAGVMKRHNFSGLRATHGVSVSHRSHGSTGQRQDPGKVFKGKKMAGHMGDRLRTMLNIEIIKTDLENELLYLKGSIPGSKNTEVVVRKSIKNINKMTISEKIAAAEEAKKTPDKKKK